MHTLVIAQYESIMHNIILYYYSRVASINTIILCILEVTVHTPVRSSLIMTASWYCAILGIALGNSMHTSSTLNLVPATRFTTEES